MEDDIKVKNEGSFLKAHTHKQDIQMLIVFICHESIEIHHVYTLRVFFGTTAK